jgi:hypothetical protein
MSHNPEQNPHSPVDKSTLLARFSVGFLLIGGMEYVRAVADTHDKPMAYIGAAAIGAGAYCWQASGAHAEDQDSQ